MLTLRLLAGVFVDSLTDFVVDTRALANLRRDSTKGGSGGDKGDGKVMCIITNPSGTRTDSFLRPLTDGTYKISYTPFEEGLFLLLSFTYPCLSSIPLTFSHPPHSFILHTVLHLPSSTPPTTHRLLHGKSSPLILTFFQADTPLTCCTMECLYPVHPSPLT